MIKIRRQVKNRTNRR